MAGASEKTPASLSLSPLVPKSKEGLVGSDCLVRETVAGCRTACRLQDRDREREGNKPGHTKSLLLADPTPVLPHSHAAACVKLLARQSDIDTLPLYFLPRPVVAHECALTCVSYMSSGGGHNLVCTGECEGETLLEDPACIEKRKPQTLPVGCVLGGSSSGGLGTKRRLKSYAWGRACLLLLVRLRKRRRKSDKMCECKKRVQAVCESAATQHCSKPRWRYTETEAETEMCRHASHYLSLAPSGLRFKKEEEEVAVPQPPSPSSLPAVLANDAAPLPRSHNTPFKFKI